MSSLFLRKRIFGNVGQQSSYQNRDIKVFRSGPFLLDFLILQSIFLLIVCKAFVELLKNINKQNELRGSFKFKSFL